MGEKGGDEKQVSQPLPQFLPDDWYTCNVGATTITTESKKKLLVPPLHYTKYVAATCPVKQ